MARSLRDAGHLPKRRPGGRPADPLELPRQRVGTTPQMHGRYPDYDVLANAENWDPVTQEVIHRRVREVPSVRFLTGEQEGCARAFFDLVLAQDAEPRIPVLEMVDAALFEGVSEGFRFAGMPDDRTLFGLVLRGLDETARAQAAASFASAPPDVQRSIVSGLSRGELSGGAWDALDVARAWSAVMQKALSAFYSHPWAWNEIGFGGPAYPRGFMRLRPGPDGREPYERAEAFAEDPVVNTPDRGD